jgi:hypothetical protein
VRWNLSVALICISFMARDVGHFFMCFFAIWTSSFEKSSIQFICPFLHCSLILGEFILFFSYCCAGGTLRHLQNSYNVS